MPGYKPGYTVWLQVGRERQEGVRDDRGIHCAQLPYRRRGGRGGRREAVHLIRFSKYNICNVRNGVLHSYLQGILQANMDRGVFQEPKFRKWIYTRKSI